ncbi:MAG: hypothetical protein V1736_08330 [Pseudomonadota bacterium]
MKSTGAGLNLFFVEHAYQAQHMLDRRADQADGQWIALGPSAMHFLSTNGIAYRTPEDYCCRDEVEELCLAQFELLMRCCRELDSILMNEDPFLREWGIRPFFFHLWQLGQVIDSLLSRTFQLRKILADYPGSDVFVHVAPPQPRDCFGIGFSTKETLWGRIIALAGWDFRLHALTQPAGNAKGNGLGKKLIHCCLSNVKERLSRWARSRLVINSVIQSVHLGYGNNIWSISKNRCSSKKAAGVVIFKWAYEWAGLLPHLTRDGYPVLFLAGSDLEGNGLPEGTRKCRPSRADDLWQTFRKALFPMPVDYSEMLHDRFSYISDYSSPVAQTIMDRLGKAFKDRPPRAILVAATAYFGCYAVKQYCRKKSIRVISWQHGAVWCDKRITQRNDLLNLIGCDQMLVYGEGVKSAYKASPLAEEEKCEIIPAGMPSLNGLRSIQMNPDDGSVNILWPFGGYYGNGWYCGFSPPSNDRVYYKEQMIVLSRFMEFLNRYPFLSITIKLYPSTYCDAEPPWVSDLPKSERIKIVHSKPNFVELLHRHQVVLIDSPTTTLLQSVATKLPVFVLMSVLRWPDDAVRLLEKRAVCAQGAEDLMASLEQYLESRSYKGHVENNLFLKRYGIHNGNGIESALSLVKGIIDEDSAGQRA